MGIFSKINFGLTKTRNKMAGAIDDLFGDAEEITEDLYAQLEEILVMGDVGVVTAVEITDRLKKRVAEKHLRGAQAVKNEIKEIVAELLDGGEDMGLVTVPSVVLSEQEVKCLATIFSISSTSPFSRTRSLARLWLKLSATASG